MFVFFSVRSRESSGIFAVFFSSSRHPSPFLISSFFHLLLFQKKKTTHRAHGDLSKMPKTDSIVAVSLNDGVIQTGDGWRRSQGYAPADAADW